MSAPVDDHGRRHPSMLIITIVAIDDKHTLLSPGVFVFGSVLLP